MGLFAVINNKRKILFSEKVKAAILEKNSSGLFSLFETNEFARQFGEVKNKKQFAFLYTLYKANDDSHIISEELGKKLKELENDPNYCYGVHRTYMDLDGEVIKDVVSSGINATGHSAQGAFEENAPNPSLNFTPLNGLAGYINLLSSYKDNNIAIICKFPKDKVDKDLQLRNKNDFNGVYIKTPNGYVVSPENIDCVVSFDGEERYPTVHSKEEILNRRKM